MNEPTDVQIIHHGGKPAFAVVPIEEYEALVRQDAGRRTTLPHEVVKMNVQQGYSLLKAWRKWAGLSQAELAKQARMTQSQIANIESGKVIPRADGLLRLSRALGMSADLLLDE